MNSETRICQNCKIEFTIEPEDFAFYEKMKVPPPTFCPECRLVRRASFRNEHFLFRRKDELTGKEVFSGLPPEAPYKTYEHDYWWSDRWDAMSYGRDYDFSQSFFAQFRVLLQDVPWSARTYLNIVASDYCEQVSYLKNSYLVFDADHVEDAAYCVLLGFVKDSYDLLSCFYSELCYEDTMVNKSYRVFYSYNCEDCHDVWLSKDCSGCTDCFGCVNLKSKQYYIFNEPYTKEAYIEKIKGFNLGSAAALAHCVSLAETLWKKFPVRYLTGWRNVASSGDYLTDTKNTKYSFLSGNSENAKFVQLVFYKTTDAYDYTVWGESASQIYECQSCGMQVDSMKFCFDCWPSCRDLEYCVSCRNASNLFGCVGLRNKQYCIFNKQYTKEEFFSLRERIVAHMETMPYIDASQNSYAYGEFFPQEFSHLAYNQSLAQDLFPITKEEAARRGFPWRDPSPREYETTLAAANIPDHIEKVPDAIMKEIIQCEACRRAYRIIEPELAFLRRIGLPVPRKCHECRLARRFALINNPRFYDGKCRCAGKTSVDGVYKNLGQHFHTAAQCPNIFETSYAPDRPEIVYCEQCYQAEAA